ncbi:MAG: hypothetical protein AAF483_08600 [Planctomycetota bacterium]
MAIVIAFIVFLGVLCGGGLMTIAFLVSMSEVPSSEYSANRGEVNANPPPSVVQSLKSVEDLGANAEFAGLTKQEMKELKEFMLKVINSTNKEDGSEQQYIDLERFVLEMEKSGLAAGVNLLSRSRWASMLEGVPQVPFLYEDFRVVGFEWLEEAAEARVTIASFQDARDDPDLITFYVVRSDEGWKLYDWRGIDAPISEVQYFAAYTNAPDDIADNYSNLGDELLEIYSAELDRVAKSERSYAAFRSKRYPEAFRPLAKMLTASYLELYSSTPEMEKMVAAMLPDKLVSSYLFAARTAFVKGEYAESFLHASKVMDQLGWHPEAVLLAAQSATSDAEKRQASQWLAMTLKVTQEHDITSNMFLVHASDQQLDALFREYADRPKGDIELAKFIDGAASAHVYVQDEYIQIDLERLQKRMSSMPQLKLSTLLARYIHSERSESEDTFELGLQILATAKNGELSEVLKYRDFMNDTCRIAFEQGQPEKFLGVEADPSKVLDALSQQCQYEWEFSADQWKYLHQEMLDLEQHQVDIPAMQIEIAKANCKFQAGEGEAAWELLLPLFNDSLLDEEYQVDAYWMLTMSIKLAGQLGKLTELNRKLPQPESAFPVIAYQLQSNSDLDGLRELVEWNKQTYPDSDSPWGEFFEAELAYSEGDWERADKLICSAYERTDEAHEELPILYADYYEDYWYSNLQEERYRFAFRTRNLVNLLQAVESVGELDESWMDLLYREKKSLGGELAGEVVGFMQGKPSWKANRFVLYFKIKNLLGEGKIQEAIKISVDCFFEESENETRTFTRYLSEAQMLALELMVVYQDFSQMTRISEYVEEPVERQICESVEAFAAGDKTRFLELIRKIDSDENTSNPWRMSRFLKQALLRSPLFEAYNKEHCIDIFNHFQIVAGGLVFLAPGSEDDFTTNLQAAATEQGVNLESIEPDLLEGANASLRGSGDDYQVLMLGLEEVPESLLGNEAVSESVTSASASGEKLYWVQLVAMKPMLEVNVELRALVATACDSISATSRYLDLQYMTWFQGEKWPSKLAEQDYFGIDPQQPVSYGYFYSGVRTWIENEDGEEVVKIGMSSVSESIPVTVEEEVSSYRKRVVLQQDSQLLPDFTKGVRFEASSTSFSN